MRIGVVCIIAVVSFSVYVSSKQLARNQRIESEVDVLRREADKIRRENETLAEKVQYFASNDFREQEAKEKLGMKKAGEEVVVIKARPGEEQERVADPVLTSSLESDRNQPNYQKWWNVFFKSRNE